jgi:transposase
MGPEVADGATQFSREFKLEAVRLVRERGVSIAQVSRDLDIRTCCASG